MGQSPARARRSPAPRADARGRRGAALPGHRRAESRARRAELRAAGIRRRWRLARARRAGRRHGIPEQPAPRHDGHTAPPDVVGRLPRPDGRDRRHRHGRGLLRLRSSLGVPRRLLPPGQRLPGGRRGVAAHREGRQRRLRARRVRDVQRHRVVRQHADGRRSQRALQRGGSAPLPEHRVARARRPEDGGGRAALQALRRPQAPRRHDHPAHRRPARRPPAGRWRSSLRSPGSTRRSGATMP